MRTNLAFSIFLIASAIGLASCSQMSTPSSPSAAARSGVINRLTTRDGDPTAPAPTPVVPAPAPPCTAAPPAPAAPTAPVAVDPNAPVPAGPVTPSRVSVRDDPPAPAPAPAAPAAPCSPSVVTDIINIVSYFGSGAFNPNPTMATVGDSIVFTNTDAREHHIVLDDGTEVGDVMPGASTAPLTLTTPTASFHCTIHPTMVGTINMPLPPDPSAYMPPPDDYYGYY